MLNSKAKQQGFGLIEMLVASFIITFGLVAMVLLQSYNQRDAFRAHHLSLAGLYAQDLQERLRSNVCYLNDSDTSQSDISDFLQRQLSAWQDEHLQGSRGVWEAALDFGTNADGDDWTATDAEENGYWRFDLTLCYAACSQSGSQRRVITQRLLIEQVAGGCADAS